MARPCACAVLDLLLHRLLRLALLLLLLQSWRVAAAAAVSHLQLPAALAVLRVGGCLLNATSRSRVKRSQYRVC